MRLNLFGGSRALIPLGRALWGWRRPRGCSAGCSARVGPRKAADGLVKVQVALGNIASKRERIKILYKKIEDLIKYLDPQYIDRMAVPDAMKLQFILAEEQFILSQVALLEQANNLQPFLDSGHIKAAPDHAAKLQRLAQIHIQQQAVTEFITSNKSKIMEHRMY
ncbi:dynactin subunit 3 [Mauremys reevesii]|uniref:dynactin subunit 3 n=1 Tax=Mauremys reevesii TaxID=260615 RepID=UPI00193F0D79|nr:dynactin subunit 3 [Mauremys reevesii]